MVKQSQLARGKKWKKIRDSHTFNNRPKEVEWINSQAAIVADIKIYEDSIDKPDEVPGEKEEENKTKSKGKK